MSDPTLKATLCPKCGTPAAPGEAFCRNCGAQLVAPTVAAVPPTEAVAVAPTITAPPPAAPQYQVASSAAPPKIGVWAVLHEIRSEYAQIMVVLFLLINGPGKWSLDAVLARLRTSKAGEFVGRTLAIAGEQSLVERGDLGVGDAGVVGAIQGGVHVGERGSEPMAQLPQR